MRIDGIDYRIAETREDLEGAVRLVYHNYIEKGYCRFNAHAMHFYLHDVLPDTRTLVASRDGEVISTMTLVFDSPLGLPSDSLYREENNALRARGRRLAEVSKLSSDRRLDRHTLRVLSQLFRLVYLLAFHLRRVDDLVILIEPHHEGFYHSAMGFVPIGGLKADPAALDAPSLLLRLDLAASTEESRRQHELQPGSSRRYNQYVLDPRLAELEAELQQSDEHLRQMHRRMEEAMPLATLSAGEQRYLDLRLFAIGFNCDKICAEAQTQDRSGRFREELELYERLLLVLPAHFEPERRYRVLRDGAVTAWHCGHFPRAMAFIAMIEREATTDRQRADALMLRGTVLHFQGRSDEAAMAFAEALFLPGLDPATRTSLLHTSARLAIDRGKMEDARLHLAAGVVSLDEVETEDVRRQLNGLLTHDRYVLEHRQGNLIAAEAALNGFRPHLEQSRPSHRIMHLGGRATLDLERGRPREALAHARSALACCDPDSSPFNASIIASTLASAALTLGDLATAQVHAEKALTWALGVQQPGTILSSASALIETHIAADRCGDVHAVLAQVSPRLAGSQPPRIAAQALALRAFIARSGRDWSTASALLSDSLSFPANAFLWRSETLLARIEIELCAGRIPVAITLAQGLPAPDELPGSDRYRWRWHVMRTVLRIVADEHGGDLSGLEEPFARYRETGSYLCLAAAAAWMLDVAQVTACATLRRSAVETLHDVTQAVSIPLYARLSQTAAMAEW